ncbi:MAG: molybdopterin-dependent oxidoreductase [Phycisphaerales bacterium]
MPEITINGQPFPFEKGQTILQVALANGIEIPHYCYHPGLSIPANCRICLAEVHAPNPRNDNKLEAIPKLLPTCQTTAGDGQHVFTTTPKAVANQKAVMEYLLINHPVDCPVCDQAGECYLQDYSYEYGRSNSRFQEAKNKQPKKDVGDHVLLYSDRCIMCTRCVRFCREVTETNELIVDGRGSTAQIDIFPGNPVNNELSGNVIDICPVGALLDKNFLFAQRVWFLKQAASIDPLTASGDNIWVEHNDGRVYRIKPRTNLEVNTWWITDEVRYGCDFVHSDDRLTMPVIKGRGEFAPAQARDAWLAALGAVKSRLDGVFARNGSLAALISPMLSCEDAYLLGRALLDIHSDIIFGVGPIPVEGEDKTFADGFTLYAEKAPNARGVTRVLNKIAGSVLPYKKFLKKLPGTAAVILTGNYPSDWATDDLLTAIADAECVVLIDTLRSRLCERADIILPAATFAEKAGTFENVNNRLQAFERAIEPIDYCKSESQIGLDLAAMYQGVQPPRFNAAMTRRDMADRHGLVVFAGDVHLPREESAAVSDMTMIEL